MSESPDSARRIEELERRVAAIEKRVGELHPAVEDHDDRLDEHDKAIGLLGVRLGDVKYQLERVATEQAKTSDAVEALAQAQAAQNGSLELILRNTASIAAALGVSK
jgi:uncharacterized coiled-coil protein SlyX